MSISNIIDSLINEDMSSIKLSNQEVKYSDLSSVSFTNKLSASDYNAINHNIRSNGKVIISFIAVDKVVVIDVGCVSYGDYCVGFVYQIKGRADTIQKCLNYIVDIVNNGGFGSIDDFLHRMKKYNIVFYSDVGFDIQNHKFMDIDYIIKSFIAKNKLITRDLYAELSKYEFKNGRDYTLNCDVVVNRSKTLLSIYCTIDFTIESGMYEGTVFWDKVVDFLHKCAKEGQCRGVISYDTFITFTVNIFKGN
nr:MAG TPA: hypothetical protein [Caudoviricetes sp.]